MKKKKKKKNTSQSIRELKYQKMETNTQYFPHKNGNQSRVYVPTNLCQIKK